MKNDRHPIRELRSLARVLFGGALLAGALFATLALPARAQEEPATVPMELVRALFGRTAIDVTVGEIPPGSALEGVVSLEELGRVVGGLAQGEGNGTVILAVDGSEEDAVRAFEELVAGRGFSRPEIPRHTWGGFVDSARVDSAPNRFRPWCGESVALTITPMTTPGGPTYLRVSYSNVEGGPCDPGTPRDLRLREVPKLPTLPTLEQPPGARVRTAGVGSSSTSMETSSTIESVLEAPAIAEHYARQLEAAGWSPVGGPEDEAASVRRFTLEDGGEPFVGVLAVLEITPGRHYAILRMDRVEGP